MEQRRVPGPPATAGPRGRHRRSPGPAPPQPQPRVPLTPPPWPEPPPPHGPAAILESHDARPPTPPAGSDAEASSSSSAGIVYFYRRRPLSLPTPGRVQRRWERGKSEAERRREGTLRCTAGHLGSCSCVPPPRLRFTAGRDGEGERQRSAGDPGGEGGPRVRGRKEREGSALGKGQPEMG